MTFQEITYGVFMIVGFSVLFTIGLLWPTFIFQNVYVNNEKMALRMAALAAYGIYMCFFLSVFVYVVAHAGEWL